MYIRGFPISNVLCHGVRSSRLKKLGAEGFGGLEIRGRARNAGIRNDEAGNPSGFNPGADLLKDRVCLSRGWC